MWTTGLAVMEADEALQRDWSSLPSDVLNLITKYLREISDFVRFRAVCIAWRISTPITDLPPQFPWILETFRELDDPYLRFYSMSSNKIYTIHEPMCMNRCTFEISEGYLLALLYDEDQHTIELSLLNPLNNEKVPLPPCEYYPHLFWQRYNQIGKYGLCCARTLSRFEHELLRWQLGQNQWSRLRWDEYRSFSLFYLKGMLFTHDKNTGFTKVTDISTGSLAYTIPSVGKPILNTSFLLEASGDIMWVLCLYNKLGGRLWEVHRLDVDESGFPCWVKVKNIGNHALFSDHYGVFMIKANEFSGIKANCIYYLYGQSLAESGLTPFEVERIDIQTGTKEHHQQCWIPFGYHVCWFVPNLCHLRERPDPLLRRTRAARSPTFGLSWVTLRLEMARILKKIEQLTRCVRGK